MDSHEFDELCKALEPRPGNDAWDLDPEYQNEITEGHRRDETGPMTARRDGISSANVRALPATRVT